MSVFQKTRFSLCILNHIITANVFKEAIIASSDTWTANAELPNTCFSTRAPQLDVSCLASHEFSGSRESAIDWEADQLVSILHLLISCFVILFLLVHKIEIVDQVKCQFLAKYLNSLLFLLKTVLKDELRIHLRNHDQNWRTLKGQQLVLQLSSRETGHILQALCESTESQYAKWLCTTSGYLNVFWMFLPFLIHLCNFVLPLLSNES